MVNDETKEFFQCIGECEPDV